MNKDCKHSHRSRIRRLLIHGQYTLADITFIIDCSKRTAQRAIVALGADYAGYRPKVGANGHDIVYTIREGKEKPGLEKTG